MSVDQGDIHRMMHGATRDALANLDNAVTISIPVTLGAIAELQGATQPIRTVSVQNRSHLWVYVSGASASPIAGAALKAIPPFTSSVFPVGATRFIELLVSSGPDGTVAPTIANETISASGSPLPTAAGQDTPISVPSTPVTVTGGITLVGASPAIAAPAANVAAQIVLPAPGVGVRYYIAYASGSYSAAPVGGNLQILDGAAVIWNEDIAQAGKTDVPTGTGGIKQPTVNQALTITLAAGGAGVLGKLNIGTVIAA